MSVQGLKSVVNALLHKREGTAKGFRHGLASGGEYLRRKSMALVPVETGVLKASARVNVYGVGWKSEAWVSYATEYALYVHEDLEAAHGAAYNVKYAKQIANAKTAKQRRRWFNRGEKQTAKFLEIPAKDERNRRVITALVVMGIKGTLK